MAGHARNDDWRPPEMGIDVLIDLRPRFGSARNQGGRPTCMAFAASDTHSFSHGLTSPLSTEYAHFHAVHRRKPHNPNRGVPMNLMLDAVREDGQPPEEVWPYLPTLPVPLSTWKPPNNCVPIFRHEFARSITDLSKVFAALDADQPVLFTARITEQFYTPGNDNIIRSAPNDPETGNHALVAVGHGNTTNAQAVVQNDILQVADAPVHFIQPGGCPA